MDIIADGGSAGTKGRPPIIADLFDDYHALLGAIIDGVMLIGGDTNITFVNASLARMLGYREADLLGHSATEFMDEAARQAISSRIGPLKAGIGGRYELTWLRRDGQSVPTLVSDGPLFDAAGHYRGSVRTVADLTEIKQVVVDYADKIDTKNAELVVANQALEEFAYSVSHDLRTPLRAIDGFSRILLDNYADKLDAEGRRLLNVVRNSTVKMGRLIDDMLAFSRAGRLGLKSEQVDMAALVRCTLAADLAPAVAGRSLAIDIRPLPAAFGDSAMLQHVWINLLDNAIKFSRVQARCPH